MYRQTYATIRGIGSGRRIAELCDPQQGETAYQWICGGVSVTYHTINDFRTAHPECLDRCLTESVAVLMNEAAIPGGRRWVGLFGVD